MADVQLKVGINYAFIHQHYDPNSPSKQGFLLQGSGGCFYGGQKVVTSKGPKELSKIRVGDKVLSHNFETKKDEYRRVEQVFKHENDKPCYKVVMWSGEEIIATHDHKFWYNNEWRPFIDLLRMRLDPTQAVDEEYSDKRISVSDILDVQPFHLMHTFDVAVEGNENYYLDLGDKQALVHNSGKTWDILQFLIVYSENNAGKGKDILITRETYAACKDSVLKDFIKILKTHNMYDVNNHVQSHPQKYHHKGNTFSFAGRDDAAAHGARRDVIYFNEIMLDENDKAFQQMNSRCAEIFICDYNPRFTSHWVYDKIKYRDDVHFMKSTFLTNKYLPQGEREEKLNWEPWHPEDRHLPYKERRPHPTNIAQGTADEYNWLIYGEGIPAAAEGIIFQYVKWIDKWPDQMGYIHCLDFGFSVDPCVLVRYNEDEHNIWIEPLSYHPMETANDVHEFALASGINPTIPAVADSADKYVSEDRGTVQMVRDLRKLGWRIEKVSKTKSVMYWLNSMKKKTIHIVKNQYYKEVLKEKENYRMRTINGVPINQPLDKFNHCFAGDTLIDTNNGLKRIKDIRSGDIVLTSQGYDTVLETFNNGLREVFAYDLKFANFVIRLVCTADHLIKTSAGWKEISKLTPQDRVYLSRSLWEKYTDCTKVSDIIREGAADYTSLYGSTIEEMCRKDTTFTTKMKIRLITEYRILRQYLEMNTIGSTRGRDSGRTPSILSSFTKKVLRLLKLGIEAKKASNGTEKMRKRRVLVCECTAKENAIYAEPSLRPRQTTKNSVLTSVNQNIGGDTNSTISRKYVNIAEENTSPTNTIRQEPVREFVLERLDSKRKGVYTVYDMSVENNHEYFANGVLVHNCWDASRYGHMHYNQPKRSAFW